MGKFETYPDTNALSDNDITLYNKSTITHKITFGTLISLIRSKLEDNGLVSSLTAGAGLLGGTITTSGTVKCNLKSETPSTLASVSMGNISGRQYAVGLDRDGRLSVNIPWTDNGQTYRNGYGITINDNLISTDLKSYTQSAFASVIGTTQNRQYAVQLDSNGYLSVNVPWVDGMATNGSNADSHVNFGGSFTVGDRTSNSSVGNKSISVGTYNESTTFGSASLGTYNSSNGYNAFTAGRGNDASGSYAIGLGDGNDASGEASVAMGHNSYALGNYSIALGSNAKANGKGSCGICHGVADGKGSTAMGYRTNSKGDYSYSQGYLTIAQGLYQTVLGACNVAQGTTDSRVDTDYALIIGNGTNNSNRSNAFAIKWDGTLVFANGETLSPSEITQLKALLN